MLVTTWHEPAGSRARNSTVQSGESRENAAIRESAAPHFFLLLGTMAPGVLPLARPVLVAVDTTMPRSVIDYRRGVLEHAAILQVGGDAGRAEGVVADAPSRCRGNRTPAHRMRVGLRQRRGAQLPGAARDRAKQRPLQIASDPGAVSTSAIGLLMA